MLKYLKTLATAAILSLGIAPWAQAAVVTNTTDQLFNAVDEISTTLTTEAGTVLTTFVSGTYAVANVVRLQREVGSPGSGTWENVTRVTGASTTANARVVTTWTTGTGTEGYRLIMTATGTGAVVAYLTDAAVTARTWVNNSSQIVMFDDFIGMNSTSTTALNASRYVTQDSNSGGGTVAVMDVAIQEGAVVMDSGTTADDGTCMSAITAASFGALVSDGWTSFELRIRSAAVTGVVTMGLSNVICVADVVPIASVLALVVDQVDGGSESLALITRDDDATTATEWQAISAIADAEGANALEVPLGVITAADTYVVLRVEIDSGGNAYFYVAGNLVHAEPLAVTTTARLAPILHLMESTVDAGAVISFIDYWEFVAPRPTG
ncbi:hypothetical protein LCGC14_0839180 [marine sediment metagenome]|uniref:Uncharacterized protein n=1 Tax=marine sediment metagenome TaxID=412755 RepID=A0A0F9PIC9_9ZZZZ